MVNVTRKSILKILLTASEPVSGNSIGERLGISKVAVWKHIKALTSNGYQIASTPKGYLFSLNPDIPDEYLLECPGVNIRHFHVVNSTMDAARQMDFGSDGYFLVTADSQTEGRGRYGSEWLSPEGGIYATIGFRPSCSVYDSGKYTMAAVFSICEVLGGIYGMNPTFKWPNAVFCGSEKAAGILTEIHGELEKPYLCLIGIGIHPDKGTYNGRTSNKKKNADSLPVSRSKTLESFIGIFTGIVEKTGQWDLTAKLSRYCPRLSGSKIRVCDDNFTVSALLENGSLQIKNAQDSLRLYPGEAFEFLQE